MPLKEWFLKPAVVAGTIGLVLSLSTTLILNAIFPEEGMIRLVRLGVPLGLGMIVMMVFLSGLGMALGIGLAWGLATGEALRLDSVIGLVIGQYVGLSTITILSGNVFVFIMLCCIPAGVAAGAILGRVVLEIRAVLGQSFDDFMLVLLLFLPLALCVLTGFSSAVLVINIIVAIVLVIGYGLGLGTVKTITWIGS
jgi:hypothetical protein